MPDLALSRARSLLFVPGDRPERFDKAAASGADVVILDLEDAVAPQSKADAREHVRRWLGSGGQAAVRVNAYGSPWFEADVEAIGSATVVLPKCSSPSDLDQLGAGAVSVIALVESAAGVANIRSICRARSVARIAFGHIDFSSEVGVDPASRPALAAARSAIVYASAEAGLPAPIDGVTTAVNDDSTLIDDAVYARQMGFGGKLCIHPRQVAIVADLLGPTTEELHWARRVVAAATDGGVVLLDGGMVDEPVVMRARRILQAGA